MVKGDTLSLGLTRAMAKDSQHVFDQVSRILARHQDISSRSKRFNSLKKSINNIRSAFLFEVGERGKKKHRLLRFSLWKVELREQRLLLCSAYANNDGMFMETTRLAISFHALARLFQAIPDLHEAEYAHCYMFQALGHLAFAAADLALGEHELVPKRVVRMLHNNMEFIFKVEGGLLVLKTVIPLVAMTSARVKALAQWPDNKYNGLEYKWCIEDES